MASTSETTTMTEEEWFDCTSVQTMMIYLTEGYPSKYGPGKHTPVSNRKLRLFAIAYCKLVAEIPEGDHDLQFIELAEQYAETGDIPKDNIIRPKRECVYWLFDKTPTWTINRLRRADFANKQTQACDLLRDIVGNPFDIQTITNVEKFNSTILTLAQEAYHGDWTALLPLSDELEEWGCVNQDVLNHLRSMTKHKGWVSANEQKEWILRNNWWYKPNTYGHTKGCWVLDLILGKA